jgi:hypothetical protein
VVPAVPFLSDSDRRTLEAAARRLMPGGVDAATEPGAVEAGALDYIEGTLTAFDVDPPRIWAGGPWRGTGGDPTNHYVDFAPLGRIEEIAWRRRIGAWQETYRAGIDALGADFADADGSEQDARLAAHSPLRDLLFEHCCEGMYSAPEYLGNRGEVGWRSIRYDGDTLPHGWTDEQVTYPEGRREPASGPAVEGRGA